MAITYTKLRDGSWGIRATQEIREGQVVTVTKKDGTAKLETIDRILWHGDGVYLATVSASAPTSGLGAPSTSKGKGQVCPECGRRAKLVYDHEDGCRKCYDCCDIP